MRRFERQISLTGFGEDGQRRLRDSSVLVLGLGAVGSVAAVYLARSGVGRLGIVDFDVVELSNLHRQPFLNEDDVGRRKVDVIASRLREADSQVILEAHDVKADTPFLTKAVGNFDVVLDAVDTFAGKLAVNETAWRSRVPLVSGGVQSYTGQVLTVVPPDSPCLRCLVQEVSEQERGPVAVFPPAAAMVGAALASEALKLLLSVGEPLIGRLLMLNAADWSVVILPMGKRRGCGTCG